MAPDASSRPDAGIAVVVLTHSRLHLLRKCVENVLLRTSPSTREIVIWDNASTDGTAEYLDAIDDPRVKVVHSPKNVGQNGYAKSFALVQSHYLVELDDDVVDAPEGWDEVMLDAYRRLPEVGFLAADLEDDPHDVAANYRYRVRAHLYTPATVNGVELLEGPAGGGCAMTSRDVYDSVGGFRENEKEVFWLEDAAYIEAIQTVGYRPTVLANLKVHHTGGPYYGAQSAEKEAYWARWNRSIARRAAAKRFLLGLPFVRRLNARFHWVTDEG